MELSEILSSPDYQNANEATKRAIFDRRVASDESFKTANEATQNAIRERWGVTVQQPEQKGYVDRLIDRVKQLPEDVVKSLTPSPVIPPSEQTPVDPNAPMGEQISQGVTNAFAGSTRKPIIGTALMGAGGAIVKGLGSVAEYVLPQLGFDTTTTAAATQPYIGAGNKILETASNVNNPMGTIGALSPYAALPMKGFTAPLYTAAATAATTPDAEDRAVAATIGGGLHAAGSGAINAVKVPYKLGQGALNIGRGEVGGVNSAIHVFTPEQKIAIQGLQEQGTISALRNAAAQTSGQAPKPGKYLESIGESVARDIFERKSPYAALETFGPTIAGGIYGGPLGAMAGAGFSLAKRAISPTLTGKALEKIVPTEMGAKVGGTEVIAAPVGTKVVPDTSMRSTNELLDALAKQKTETPVVPDTVTMPVVSETPVAPRGIAGVLDRINEQYPGLKADQIESNAIKQRAAELAQEQKAAGQIVLDKAANTQLARSELMKHQAEIKARQRAEYEASPEFKQRQEAEAARVAEQQRVAQEQAAAKARADAEAAVVAEQVRQRAEQPASAAIEPTPVVTEPTITTTPVAPVVTPTQKLNPLEKLKSQFNPLEMGMTRAEEAAYKKTQAAEARASDKILEQHLIDKTIGGYSPTAGETGWIPLDKSVQAYNNSNATKGMAEYLLKNHIDAIPEIPGLTEAQVINRIYTEMTGKKAKTGFAGLKEVSGNETPVSNVNTEKPRIQTDKNQPFEIDGQLQIGRVGKKEATEMMKKYEQEGTPYKLSYRDKGTETTIEVRPESKPIKPAKGSDLESNGFLGNKIVETTVFNWPAKNIQGSTTKRIYGTENNGQKVMYEVHTSDYSRTNDTVTKYRVFSDGKLSEPLGSYDIKGKKIK